MAALAPFLAAFFYAPLAFGGTTPETVRTLDWLLVHGFLLWLCVLVLERRRPRLPRWFWIPGMVLGLIGLAHCMNPVSFVDPTFGDLQRLENPIGFLPGSVDAASTRSALVHLAALFLAGLALCDALACSQVRWLLFRTVALAGLVIAVIGIYQKATGAEAMLWSGPKRFGENFFAAFRYHANAASFLNLSWPAALAVWLRSHLIRSGSLASSLDLCVFFLLSAAVFVNSSKAGQILGIVGLILAAWRFRAEISIPTTSRTGAIVIGLFLVLLAGVLILPGLLGAISKWKEFAADGGSLVGRLYAYRACLGAVADAGFFGHGAGTFRLVFPYHTLEYEDQIWGYWYHAHQDWLQTLIEWGWLGFCLWALIFGGALRRLFVRCSWSSKSGQRELSASVALLALLLVLVHALVDFPLQIPALQWLVVFYLAIGWSDPQGTDQGTGPSGTLPEVRSLRAREASAFFQSSQATPAMRRKVRVSDT